MTIKNRALAAFGAAILAATASPVLAQDTVTDPTLATTDERDDGGDEGKWGLLGLLGLAGLMGLKRRDRDDNRGTTTGTGRM